MKEKFPVLKNLSNVLKLFAYILLIIGIGYFILYQGIYEPQLPHHRFSSSDMMQIQLGIGISIISLTIIGFAELIKVILEIEKNTRK